LGVATSGSARSQAVVVPAHSETYNYETIDNPLASSASTLGTYLGGINNKGQISGYYSVSGSYNPFVYAHGIFTNLPNPPGNVYVITHGINDKGEIAGYNAGEGFVYGYGDGTYMPINFPSASETAAEGINNPGQVVGWYFVNNIGIPEHSFLYSHGVYTNIDDPLAVYGTFATGVNNKGQIVGYYIDNTGNHGFLFSRDTYTTIDDPPTLFRHRVVATWVLSIIMACTRR
jgi:probable HAF family extracellular repeat protein